MKEFTLHFDKKSHEETDKKIREFVALFNKTIEHLKVMGGSTLTTDDVNAWLEDKRKFLNEIYDKKYTKACEFFGVNPNEAVTFDWKWHNGDMATAISNMAKDSSYLLIKKLVEDTSNMFWKYGERELFFKMTIQDEDGKLRLVDGYEEGMKEAFTTYARSDKEIKLFTDLQKISEILKSHGLSHWDLRFFLFNDETVDGNAVQRHFDN